MRPGEENLDDSHILSGCIMVLLFRRGNTGEKAGLGRTGEEMGRGNEFNFGHFELEVSVGYK